MFSGNRISDLSPLSNWNTENVTNMKYMFSDNRISDLSSLADWNVGNVTNMYGMLSNNRISDLSSLSNWNTGNVTDASFMFERNRISDLSPLSNWNTGNATNMIYMFNENQISDLSPLSNWNTDNVTNMNGMFGENQISDLSPLVNWNTDKVTNMSHMFARNRISDLSPLASWNTGEVTDMDKMFDKNPLNVAINSQSILNKFHGGAYKFDNTGTLASHSESRTFNDGLQILLDKNVVTENDSATLTFKANGSTGNTYQIKIYNPNESIDIQAAALPTALGTTDTSYQDGYTIITNKFINNGSVSQDISITQDRYYRDPRDKPFFAQYESTSGLITVAKNKEDLGSINITYQNVSDISNYIASPSIGKKPYINNTQNTFYFEPDITGNHSINGQYSFVKSAELTITVPDDVTIDPDTFIDAKTGKTLKGTKIADHQYQAVLDNTTDGIAVKGLINVPADKLTDGTAHLPGFDIKYTIHTYNDKVAPVVATNPTNDLSVIPGLASYHGDLIKINQSKWAFDRNSNEVDDYTEQGFTNAFNGVPLEPAVSTQVTNGVETFDMPTGVNITSFDPQFNEDVIDHIDYIFTDGLKQTVSSLDRRPTPKAIRQMKVYFKNGIQGDELYEYPSNFNLSFDATYPDGSPIKNFDTFKITGSFSCDELGSADNIDVAQVMLAPTQKLTDGMLTGTNQDESNKAPNASGDFINAEIFNDNVPQHQGHLTNPIFYFKYNDLMVPDLSKISASYDNQNKGLGSIGLTNIDNNKIHSSIITDNAGQKFVKVQIDGEYYYVGSSDSNPKSGFNVKIPISNTPDALSATKDWSWYILNDSDEAKTESTIQNSSQGNKPLSVTVDGNALSVGGTGTWQIIVAQGFTSGTETQGNLNGGPGLASTQDDHQQYPTHFNIYDSIINATNDAKSGLVSVANLPSTQDGKSQFNVHMTGKASLINVVTGQAYDANITYSYGTGDNNFITGDQVTDWSKVKSIKVVPNGGAPSMTSLRLVVPVEDKTVYDDVGKTIYMSTMTYGEDKANTNYTTKDGFAVPEKSAILPIIIKPGDAASAKLTVQGQATVHTLVHYKDVNGKDVYVKLPDQDKTYNELQDTMKRSDYLQSDRDLTTADRGLLPIGLVINYSNPTIRNSNNTYAAGYANGTAAFDKTAKYDFDGDQVIFEGAMPEVVTKTHQAKETIHYVYRDGSPAKPDKVLTSVTVKQTGYKNPFTGEITWNTSTTDTLNSVDSPEITGYIADQLTVPSYTVTMDSPDKEVTVTYDTDNENADFTYFDDTTNSALKVVNKSGKSNTSIGYTTTDEINSYVEKGYTLVSDDTDGRNLNFDSLPTIDQHYTIHLKHKTESVTRNDTVTRTIHYLYDNGDTAQPDKTQTVSFNETGTKDDVTNKTTWSNDNAQTVDSVDTPNIVGYTPDKSSIEGQSFKFGDPDINVTVTYHANMQTAKITYIDDTTKNNLDSKETSGKFGQAITFETAPADEIANYKKQGYKLVSNDFDGNKYQADNSKNVFHVHFVHDTKNVSRNDDVNMTVHYVMDDNSDAPSDNKQSLSFTENGIQDLVTQKITWTPAVSQTLNNVTSPVLTGYTPDKENVVGQTVNFGDPDINVTVTYHANAQTATITYIDDTTKTNLKSKDTSGKFGQAIAFATAPADEIANYKKQGYKLVSNDFNDNKYQADNSKNVFYVHFVHDTKKVNREHSASFTVHYIYKDGKQAKPDHKQTLSFTENGIQDLVTQKITWTPADSQKFDDVETPVITGYTPDQNKVIGQTANFETGDREVTVTYSPNVQIGHITYIDDNTGKTLTRDDFSGRTNEHEDYTSIDRIQEFENKGYVFVSSDYPDGGFNFDDNDQQDQVFNVHLKHGIVTVTSKNPQIPNTTIDPDPHSPKYPEDISNTNSDVKRTIDYKFKDGKTAQPTVNDSLHFERTVVIDKVTGAVSSDTWTTSQDFNDVQMPVIQGYTPDKTVVSDKNIGHDHQDIVEHVVYSPDTQHMTITYIDDTTGETLHTDNPNGVSDQDANYTTGNTIKQYEEKHYKLVSDSTKGQDLIFDHDDNANQTYEVHFVHNTHAINQTTSPKQTIHYVYADGSASQGKAADDNVQQLSFKRDGYNDEVTGADHWNAWTPANSNYNAVDSPVIQGYTPDKLSVDGSTVNPTDKDTEITVVYNANKQTAKITYIDDTTNTKLDSKDASGKFGQTITFVTTPADEIENYKKKGYVFVSNNFDNQTYQAVDSNNVFEVHFKHGTVTVTTKNPQTPDTPINQDSHSPKYPDDINNTNKDVKRTIDYKFKDGKTVQPTVNDSLHFERTVVIDKVTGAISSDTWTQSQDFNDIQTPAIQGYTPDKAVVSDKNIGHDHQDIVEHVVYSPDTQHMTITYIDDTTGETLHTDNPNGVSDQDANYTTGNTIKQYEDQHYKLVSDSTNGKDLIFDHDDNANQTYEVHFVHNTHAINQTTSPKQTIHYIYADDLARQGKAADDNVQQLSFKRDGYNDEVTGLDHWNAWTPANGNYNAVNSPVVQGYTPDKSVIEKSTVNPTDKDIEITVVYNADKQAARIIYVDKTTNTTLISDNLSGKSDKDSGYNTKDTIGKYQSQHYVLTEDETNGKNVIFDHNDKQDQTYYVYLVHDTQKVNRQDTVTSTIDYKFEDGTTAKPTVTQTKQFSEDGIKDLVTGEITWDKATSQKFEDVATKSIVGYTPDKDNVVGSTVKFGDQDVEVTVTYHNNAQTAKITYIDDTEKKTLGSDQQNGKFDHEITFEHDPAEVIKGLEEKGYKLVSDNFKPGVKYQNDNKSNSFEVHLVHTYEPVETSQTITETVHYIDANGKPVAPDHVATVVIKVTGTRDKVTDSITWNTPSTGHFDEVISPVVPNMTPDKKFISGRDVQYGDSDITENVVYTSDETSREPEKPNDQGKPNSKTPEKPNKSGNPTSKTPEKPNKSGNPTSKTSEKSNKSSKEVVSKQFGTIAKTTIPEKPIDSRTVDNHVSAKSTAKRELPQTGTTANNGIWTGLVSIIASLGLLGASKKRKKN